MNRRARIFPQGIKNKEYISDDTRASFFYSTFTYLHFRPLTLSPSLLPPSNPLSLPFTSLLSLSLLPPSFPYATCCLYDAIPTAPRACTFIPARF